MKDLLDGYERIYQNTPLFLAGVHYAYYGVTGNSKSIQNFYYEVERLLFKWLGRRGKRGSLTFWKFRLLLQHFPLPTPRIVVQLW